MAGVRASLVVDARSLHMSTGQPVTPDRSLLTERPQRSPVARRGSARPPPARRRSADLAICDTQGDKLPAVQAAVEAEGAGAGSTSSTCATSSVARQPDCGARGAGPIDVLANNCGRGFHALRERVTQAARVCSSPRTSIRGQLCPPRRTAHERRGAIVNVTSVEAYHAALRAWCVRRDEGRGGAVHQDAGPRARPSGIRQLRRP
ncbi:MAG: hypothetical protein R2695_08075 [Acidimicrobiales bacterium]